LGPLASRLPAHSRAGCGPLLRLPISRHPIPAEPQPARYGSMRGALRLHAPGSTHRAHRPTHRRADSTMMRGVARRYGRARPLVDMETSSEDQHPYALLREHSALGLGVVPQFDRISGYTPPDDRHRAALRPPARVQQDELPWHPSGKGQIPKVISGAGDVCPRGVSARHALTADHRGRMNRPRPIKARDPDHRFREAEVYMRACGVMLGRQRHLDLTPPPTQRVRELGTDEVARLPVHRLTGLIDDGDHHHSDAPSSSVSVTAASSRKSWSIVRSAVMVVPRRTKRGLPSTQRRPLSPPYWRTHSSMTRPSCGGQ